LIQRKLISNFCFLIFSLAHSNGKIQADHQRSPTLEPAECNKLTIEHPNSSFEKLKHSTNRYGYPHKKLIMNNGNSVLGTFQSHPMNINKDLPIEMIQNFKSMHKRKNLGEIDSFGRLGFQDNTKNDPNFNPHHEYNLIRVNIFI